MQRRTFLQSLAALLIRPPWRTPAAPQQRTQPAYTDSAGRTPEQLACLHDGNRASGGVIYQP